MLLHIGESCDKYAVDADGISREGGNGNISNHDDDEGIIVAPQTDDFAFVGTMAGKFQDRTKLCGPLFGSGSELPSPFTVGACGESPRCPRCPP